MAVESGSRSWGFASDDSDYDVRIIYVHEPRWYWHLDGAAEHIEHESRGAINIPITDDLDIAGWDLRKALGLMAKCNPPLSEWLSSPIIYKRDPVLAQELLELSAKYFSAKAVANHYLHMADSNFRQYMYNKPEVVRKKYLYAIRPILACRWIEANANFPPMEIDRTMECIKGQPIEPYIRKLIAEKRIGSELGSGPADKEIENFLNFEIQRLKKVINAMPSEPQNLSELNEYFRKTLLGR